MAAGLGFKTFNTGDVLSAADTNGYLMQGVLVFADAAARDAAITSPQEGQCCYLKDTDAVQTYSGTAWVGFDDSNAIQNAIVDAKGDIVAASGNDTPARLAVGNNGDTLVADSAATTGLRYIPLNNAGKNGIINGGFDVWQRGTSISISASSNKYTADRWLCDANANQALTVSRQATADTTNLPFIQYCLRVQRNSGQTGTGNISPGTPFETSNTIPYAGKTVTFSFYARKGADYSAASSALGFYIYTGTGTDQNPYSGFTGGTQVMNSTATLTTTWQRFSASVTLGTSVTQISPFFTFTPVGTASTNDYFEVTGVQLEVGSVATTFSRNAGTLQGELAACQRYYVRWGGTGAYEFIGLGTGATSTIASISVMLPVQMRIAPTTVDYSTLGIFDATAVTGSAVPTIVSSYTGTKVAGLDATVASGVTVNRPYRLITNNSTSGFLGLSAEL
jgi:hypothetical protein